VFSITTYRPNWKVRLALVTGIIIHAIPVPFRAWVGVAHEVWVGVEIAPAIADGAVVVVNSASGEPSL